MNKWKMSAITEWPMFSDFIVCWHVPAASSSRKNMAGLKELFQSTGNTGLTLPGGTAQGSDQHEQVHGPVTRPGHPKNLTKIICHFSTNQNEPKSTMAIRFWKCMYHNILRSTLCEYCNYSVLWHINVLICSEYWSQHMESVCDSLCEFCSQS